MFGIVLPPLGLDVHSDFNPQSGRVIRAELERDFRKIHSAI